MNINKNEMTVLGVEERMGNIERMGNDRIAKRVYVRKCMGSYLVGQLQKMLIDSLNDR